MAANTYSPKDVIVTFAGYTISGFAEDSKITVAPASDDFTRTLGVDGFISRTKIENNAWTVTLFLQTSSPSNDILTGILQRDRNNNEAGRLNITDLYGTSQFSSSYAWITTRPTVAYAASVGTNEWVLHTDNSNYNIGNNFVPGIQNGN